MQPLQICIGPTIRIGRESWYLPYAGFFSKTFPYIMSACFALARAGKSSLLYQF